MMQQQMDYEEQDSSQSSEARWSPSDLCAGVFSRQVCGKMTLVPQGWEA